MNSLPGQTPIDLSGLKIRGVTNRGELDQVEAENVSLAFAKYLSKRPNKRLAPFTLSWTKRLHREMFGKVWKWAGEFRTCDLNLGISWHQIEVALQNLLDDMPVWAQHGTSLLEQAAMLHYRAVAIHPFRDGNGRWSRLLANIWLGQNGAPITLWPETTIGRQSAVRSEYLDAIKQADQGDHAPLIDLQRRFAEGANPEPNQPEEPLLPSE